MITLTEILQNILKIRVNKGFSQQVVAQNLGIEQSSYSLIENGKRELTVERLLQIELKKDKKEQVMKLIFGDNNLEILNK